jgi:hypothetical protein
MCVITDENHIVVSVSLIFGAAEINSRLNVYFPVVGDIPSVGDMFIGKRLDDGTFKKED